MKGWIFDIKHYSLHDGPGIRTTVFLKGCNLNCLWCHNPESISPKPELMHWSGRCTRCYSCAEVCPTGAINRNDSGAVNIDRKICNLCGKCVEACLYNAMQIAGREMSIEDVMQEIEKDRIFYDQSHGGVTLSGGEPLVQNEFTEELLECCRSRGIHTTIETAGFSSSNIFERIAKSTDLVLYDLKFMDDALSRKYTGANNIGIMNNLKLLAANGAETWIRIPLVAGINDDDSNIKKTAAFITSLKTVRRIGILPYHSGGIEKARRLGKESQFKRFESPSEERLREIEAVFRESNLEVNRGG